MFHQIARMRQQRQLEEDAGRQQQGEPVARQSPPVVAAPPATQESSSPEARAVRHDGEVPDATETGRIVERDVSPEALARDAQAMAILSQYHRARGEFGLARIRMGSYLYLIRENRLWEGVAENWESFLAAENINHHAARQYMSVAKTFIFDMDLAEDVLAKLSIAGISALEKAAKVINENNREEVIGILTNLAEKDAIQRIVELSGGEAPIGDKPTLRVLRLLKEFFEMPPDLQGEFLVKVNTVRRKNDDEGGQPDQASRRRARP